MNPVNVVLVYTLYGRGSQEIAIATGLTEEQVCRLQMSDLFYEMHEAIKKQMLSTDAMQVDDFLKGVAHSAAKSLAMLTVSDDPSIALKASTEILDRTGHKVLNRSFNLTTRLKVHLRIIVRNQEAEQPTIDLD
jgi:purine-nucleoside phosphorylase